MSLEKMKFIMLILPLIIGKVSYGQKDIFESKFIFNVEDLYNDKVDMESILKFDWFYNEKQFQKEITDENVTWEKSKNRAKQEIDKKFRSSELTFSKHQILESQLKKERFSKKFLLNNLEAKKELKRGAEMQKDALDEYLESIINSRKIYGIYKSEFYILLDEIHSIPPRKLHDYGEEIIKNFVKRTIARRIYEEEIFEINNLSTIVKNIVTSIETSNISIPHNIHYKLSDNSDTLKVITLVALSMSNKEYESNDLFAIEDEILDKIGNYKTVQNSEKIEALYIKQENASSAGQFNILRKELEVQAIQKMELFKDWFEEVKSIVDRSVGEDQEKRWKEEIKEYLSLKTNLRESEGTIRLEIDDIEKQIMKADLSINNYNDQICRQLSNLKILEKERIEKITSYKQITKSRIFYGSSKGSASTGEEYSLLHTLKKLLLDKVEELQSKHVREYSKTYISEMNNVTSLKEFEEIIQPEITRICILDLKKLTTRSDLPGIILDIDYGYELKLEIAPKYQRKFKPTSFSLNRFQNKLKNNDEKALFDAKNRLVWKQSAFDPNAEKYGLPSDNIKHLLKEKQVEGWRLPTVGEMELFQAFLNENDDLKLEEYNIEISKKYPFWTSETFIGPSNAKMRRAVMFSKDQIEIIELDQTDSGYFIWVGEVSYNDSIYSDCF